MQSHARRHVAPAAAGIALFVSMLVCAGSAAGMHLATVSVEPGHTASLPALSAVGGDSAVARSVHAARWVHGTRSPARSSTRHGHAARVSSPGLRAHAAPSRLAPRATAAGLALSGGAPARVAPKIATGAVARRAGRAGRRGIAPPRLAPEPRLSATPARSGRRPAPPRYAAHYPRAHSSLAATAKRPRRLVRLRARSKETGRSNADERAAFAQPENVTDVTTSVTPAIAGTNDGVYTIGFTTSSQGALTAGQDDIYVSPTGWGGCDNGDGTSFTITDTTSGATATVPCYQLSGFTTPIDIGAGDHVTITTAPVYLPAGPGVHTVQVSTSIDGPGDGSYTLKPAANVTAVTASTSPAIAGTNDGVYTIGFTTSSQGALTAGQDDIYVSPTGWGGCDNGDGTSFTITDTTSGATATVPCYQLSGFTTPIDIGAGDHVTITTAPVYLPAGPGVHTVQVSTSIDGPGDGSYTLKPAANVTAVTASTSPAIAGTNDGVYTIGFTTSSQGALTAGQDDIYVSPTGWGGCDNGDGTSFTITDTTSGATATVPCYQLSGFTTPIDIGAGDHVTITTAPVYLPAGPGVHTVQVSTSIDGPGDGSYTLKPAANVTAVTASTSPAIAGTNDGVYTIGFTTSSQGALTAGQDDIYVSPTGWGGCDNGDGTSFTITDTTSGATATVPCYQLSGFTTPIDIGAGDHVTITTAPVYLPAGPGVHTVQVSTSIDGPGDGSYTLKPAANVTAVTASTSPAIAGTNDGVYTIGFTTSSQGALTAGQDDIYVSPTGWGGCDNGDGTSFTITDTTSGATATVPCYQLSGFTTPIDIGAGDHVTITTAPVYLPAGPGVHTVQVSTSIDGPGDGSYTLTGSSTPQAVSDVTASVTPALAGSSDATYTIGFTTSSTGALTANQDTISASLPGIGQYSGTGTITDTTTGATGQFSDYGINTNFTTPIDIGAGDHVTITTAPTFNTPDSIGTQTVAVSTSQDTTGTGTYTLSKAVQTVTNVTASVTPALAGSSDATYTIGFTTSSTGALTANQDTISASLPGIGQYSGTGTITDTTTGATGQFSDYGINTNFTTPIDIGAGDHVTITTAPTFNTPDSIGTQTVAVSTSQDTTGAGTYTLSKAVQTVTNVTASVTPALAGSSDATYTIGFTTSSTGALTANQDTISASLPGIGQYSGTGTITDTTTGATGQFSDYGINTNFTTPIDIGAGDHVTITTAPTFNTPDSIGTQTVAVSTSQDTTGTGTYTLSKAVQTVTNVTASVTPALAGSSDATYTIGFTTSSTGALTANQDTISASLPGIGQYSGTGTITDTTTGATGQFSDYGINTNFTTPIDIGAGDHVTITTAPTFNTPDSIGTQTVAVSTSQDTTGAGTYTLSKAVQTVTNVTASVTPALAGSSDATYTIGFTTSSTGALTANQDTISASLPGIGQYSGTGTITDTTTGATGQFSDYGINTNFTTPIDIGAGDHVTLTTAPTFNTPTTVGTQTVAVSTSQDTTGTGTYDLAPAGPGLAVDVVDGNGDPIPGADVLLEAADGTQYRATSDSSGFAVLENIADGSYTVDAYASGYLPATSQATVSGGIADVTITLQAGQTAVAQLSSTELTYPQIVALGLNPNDPANQNVYEFSANLAFTPISGIIIPGASGTGELFQLNGSADACTSDCPVDGGWVTPEYVGGQPELLWMVIPFKVSWLKQFFTVQMVVSNLASSGFALDDGTTCTSGSSGPCGATLSLPPGLSLAPTPTPQSLTQTLGQIPGGGSASVNWIVRGDTEGYYQLTATYNGELDAVNDGSLDPLAPISIIATTPSSPESAEVHVWGGSALQITVDADDAAYTGCAYRVRVGVTNVADIPVYNLAVEIDPPGSTHEGYTFPAGEQQTYATAEIDPGDTYWTPYYVLISQISGTLDLAQSFTLQTGGNVSVPTTIADHGELCHEIMFTSTPPTPAAVGGTYTPQAVGGPTDSPATYAIDSTSTPGACSISNGTVSFAAAGTCVIDATAPAGNGFAAPRKVQQKVTIGGALFQTITFESTPQSPVSFGSAYAPVAVGGASGNPVVFSIAPSSTPSACSIASGIVSLTAAGKCVIDANQAAGSGYPAAKQVQQIVRIGTTPVLTGVSPNAGPTGTGGQTVTITGSGFTSGASVKFGSTAATIVAISPTEITATVPAHSAAGTVYLTVTTAAGSSRFAAAAKYTYEAQPTVTRLSPASGPAAGGTTVTITGTGFAAGATVQFGTTDATTVTYISRTTLKAAAPGGSGTVAVTVTTPGGTSIPNPPESTYTYTG